MCVIENKNNRVYAEGGRWVEDAEDRVCDRPLAVNGTPCFLFRKIFFLSEISHLGIQF